MGKESCRSCCEAIIDAAAAGLGNRPTRNSEQARPYYLDKEMCR